MAAKLKGKRSAPTPQAGPSKKRKLSGGQSIKPFKKKPVEKGKEKAADRGIIPIPETEYNSDLSEDDFQGFEEFGDATASFLNKLDHKGIMRSKKETERLHQLNKPIRKSVVDNLPALDSQDEDVDWSSGIEGYSTSADSDENSGERSPFEARALSPSSFGDDSDAEMPYETVPRKQHSTWANNQNEVERLPIKLANGTIQGRGSKLMRKSKVSSSSEDSDEGTEEEIPQRIVEDVSTGARFGRPAVLDVIGIKSKAARIESAKDQIAGICQDILADPESSLGLLRRLHSFSLKKITTPAHPTPVFNDSVIRKLAILSQLAIFKDVIPGYRIRPLTDAEKAEKVSQMVTRTREWEQGLLSVYQTFLRGLEGELKNHTEFADIALHCMCTLLTEVTHFNFRVNIMTCIVTRLSKKSWDKSSELCLNTLITVFREDLTGLPSLEIVRLLNRMVKERRFRIHPEVLSCLLHLRLRTELGVRASDARVDKDQPAKQRYHGHDKRMGKHSKVKAKDKLHISKKARKEKKEKKEIDTEMREAEAEVDKEERANNQTETLKLLFVLYFQILKNPKPTPLLPAALTGISKFAHLVNIDFFKDLLKVLKNLVIYEPDSEDEQDTDDRPVVHNLSKDVKDVSHRLLCIVTAFELLSGQGEALNIDLSDFVTQLYAMIVPLTLIHDIDTRLPPSIAFGVQMGKAPSLGDMLFRALNVALSPRTFGTTPPWRSAAFAKRLLSAALHWPPSVALRALDLVRGLVAKDAKVEALLSTEDRLFDGVYRPEVDDPQLCHPFGSSFFELHALKNNHWDPRVREEAQKLVNFTT